MKIFSSKNPLYESLRHLRGAVIVLDAVIGAGKTSLGLALLSLFKEVQLPAQFFEEEVDEQFLELFLSDKSRYAYAFQMHMLAVRQKIYMSAINFAHQNNGISIVDRSLYGDFAFAQMHTKYGNISQEELSVYSGIVQKTPLPEPSVILYLDVSPQVALERIVQRNRGSEVAVYDIQYLQDLNDQYKKVFEKSGARVTRIDWNKSRSLDREDLLYVCGLLDPRQ